MKTKLTVLLAFALSVNAIASTTPEIRPFANVFSVTNFGNFNVHRQHNSAALNWIFNDNASYFIIQRSYDGANFGTIAQQAPGSGHWNKYLDTTVEPGTIYYRIIAVLTDGSHEDSPVAEVRIVRHR